MVYSTGQPYTINFDYYIGPGNFAVDNDRLLLHPSTCGRELYDYIEQNCAIPMEKFDLYLACHTFIDLSTVKDLTMSEIGVDFSFNVDASEEDKPVLFVTSLDIDAAKQLAFWAMKRKKNSKTICGPEEAPCDDKESLTLPECVGSQGPMKIFSDRGPLPKFTTIRFDARRVYERSFLEDRENSEKNSVGRLETGDNSEKNSVGRPETGYVGLVNQAMTCYLNSLLQALYMTPEFRNALYNWEYVDGSEKDEANSIPYQLQKLFLNLQTSSKSAVETTSLTKSFGWDSTEAWQQHDIQELCRVMFDALERKFANTEQADLISRLYEGKMTDYVKCLECQTEKTREDTFLDIPLPVRPFGSNIAHNSVEEALRAFVQYETLEGANQYHCEKCNKKCDAHKGLKFSKFPYLLTLHLKRFDFDYKTFHRIKLNDKVTFPDVLNLNSFIVTALNEDSPDSKEDINFSGKCDDSSTTDSGTINEDCTPFENSLSNSSHSINRDHDDDEGIDIYNGPSTSNCSSQAQETENNRINDDATEGPYQYELFSILIHSGTAIGGHYYAYIKDFRTQDWLCFNDQIVTEITHDDIQKTYGGGPPRGYYYSTCKSSTNAYMLMYRQIDPARNAQPMQVEEFPKHIQALLKKMNETEDDKIKRKILRAYKIRICYHPPFSDEWEELTLYKLPNITLAELTEQAYEKLYLDKIVSLDECRLVSYDPIAGLIIESYEEREEEFIGNIWPEQKAPIVLLMETRTKLATFDRYPGGVITKVYVINVAKKEIVDGPINVRAVLTQTLGEYKQMLGTMLNIDPKQMQIAPFCQSKQSNRNWPQCDDDDFQGLEPAVPIKIFVASVTDAEVRAFYSFATKYSGVISLHVQLPDVSKEILESLNIVRLDDKPKEIERPPPPKVVEKVVTNNVQTASAATGDGEEEWNTPEQSNSEDSSLSDSDKTLIRVPPDDDDDDYLSTNDVLQLPNAVPTEFHSEDFSMRGAESVQCSKMWKLMDTDNWAVDDDFEFYFKAVPSTTNPKSLKILVEKTIRMNRLKKHLEHYVGVPVEYFRIYNISDEEEPNGRLLFGVKSCEDGQKLNIKLKRSVGPDEFEVKLYSFIHDACEPYTFLMNFVLSKEKTVRQTKEEILEELEKFGSSVPLHRCRLRIRVHDTPSKVMLDDQKIEEYQFCMGYDKMIAVQILDEPDPVTDPNQVIIFVRKWDPITNEYGEKQEIVLDEKTRDEVTRKISAISDIPYANIEIAKRKPFGGSGFWLDGYITKIQNGAVLLYRNSAEQPIGDDDDRFPKGEEDVFNILSGNAKHRGRRQQKGLQIFARTF